MKQFHPAVAVLVACAALVSAAFLAPALPNGGAVLLGNVLLDVRPLSNNVINVEAGPNWSTSMAEVDLDVGAVSRTMLLCDKRLTDQHRVPLKKNKSYRFKIQRTGDKAVLKAYELVADHRPGKDGIKEKQLSDPALELELRSRPNTSEWVGHRYLKATASQEQPGGLVYSKLEVGLGDKLVTVYVAAR